MSQPLEKLEKEIQEAIANNGFHVNAISKFCDCEKCKSEGVVQPEFSTDIMDGYVYTAGFSEKGIPKLLKISLVIYGLAMFLSLFLVWWC